MDTKTKIECECIPQYFRDLVANRVDKRLCANPKCSNDFNGEDYSMLYPVPIFHCTKPDRKEDTTHYTPTAVCSDACEDVLMQFLETSDPPAPKSCRQCQKFDTKTRPLTRCGACKHVVYCSSECQMTAWKAGHNKICHLLSGKTIVEITDTTQLVPADETTMTEYEECKIHAPILITAFQASRRKFTRVWMPWLKTQGLRHSGMAFSMGSVWVALPNVKACKQDAVVVSINVSPALLGADLDVEDSGEQKDTALPSKPKPVAWLMFLNYHGESVGGKESVNYYSIEDAQNAILQRRHL
jgi:hypothetical protein